MMFFCLALGCTKEQPYDFSSQKMMDVMVDLHYAEALVNKQPKELRDSFSKVYHEQIYEIHQVNKDSIELFFKRIQKMPKQGEAFYEKLLEETKKKTAQIGDKSKVSS